MEMSLRFQIHSWLSRLKYGLANEERKRERERERQGKTVLQNRWLVPFRVSLRPSDFLGSKYQWTSFWRRYPPLSARCEGLPVPDFVALTARAWAVFAHQISGLFRSSSTKSRDEKNLFPTDLWRLHLGKMPENADLPSIPIQQIISRTFGPFPHFSTFSGIISIFRFYVLLLPFTFVFCFIPSLSLSPLSNQLNFPAIFGVSSISPSIPKFSPSKWNGPSLLQPLNPWDLYPYCCSGKILFALNFPPHFLSPRPESESRMARRAHSLRKWSHKINHFASRTWKPSRMEPAADKFVHFVHCSVCLLGRSPEHRGDPNHKVYVILKTKTSGNMRKSSTEGLKEEKTPRARKYVLREREEERVYSQSANIAKYGRGKEIITLFSHSTCIDNGN